MKHKEGNGVSVSSGQLTQCLVHLTLWHCPITILYNQN